MVCCSAELLVTPFEELGFFLFMQHQAPWRSKSPSSRMEVAKFYGSRDDVPARHVVSKDVIYRCGISKVRKTFSY